LDSSVMSKADVESVIPQVGKLADIYEAILNALIGSGGLDGGALDAVGPVVKGALNGWRYALTRARFEPWRTNQDTVQTGAAPVAMTLGSTAPAGSPGLNAASGPGGRPPAPDAEPPGLKPKKPSREALRKAGGMGAPPTPGTPLPSDASDALSNAPSDDVVDAPATSGETPDV
jgi:hypothetical protein